MSVVFEAVPRHYTPLNRSTDFSGLSVESQAGLAQLSLDRLLAYGCDLSDAQELRARVETGVAWVDSAASIISRHREGLGSSDCSTATRIGLLRRISALLRASQLMMTTDTDARRQIFVEASALHEEAGSLEGSYRRLLIGEGAQSIVAWLYPSPSEAGPVVVVVGGIEGWAMDLHALGVEIAKRGMTALLLDGPGQGETRIRYRHFMGRDWISDYQRIISRVVDIFPDKPIGLLGNSMGGSFATLIASADSRISACCNNGGIEIPLGMKRRQGFFPKVKAFCGDVSDSEADAVWSSVQAAADSVTLKCPYMIVQGELDPLVTVAESERMLAWAGSTDKSMYVFSDGIHCVYNHAADMRNCIADWFSQRLHRL